PRQNAEQEYQHKGTNQGNADMSFAADEAKRRRADSRKTDLVLANLFPHEHRHDKAEVVEGGNHGGQHANHGEANVTVRDGFLEDVELAHEADGRRNAEKAEHGDGHADGREWLAMDQPAPRAHL